jgi:hypothetical protein
MDSPILRFEPQSLREPHIRHSLPRVTLEIMRGRARQRLRPVAGRVFLIGAAADCDLVLGDSRFPDTFAYLLVQEEAVLIRRLGTGPELLIDGQASDSAQLQDGDRVAFGPFEFGVRIVANVQSLPSRPMMVFPTMAIE